MIAHDPVGQRIIASVSSAIDASSTGGTISKQSIAEALPSALANANVDIQLVDQPIAQPTTTYGGTDARIGTSLVCTNGFTVKHPMSFADAHLGNWGDMAWFSTNGTEVDDFYADELGNRVDVTATESSVNKGAEFIYFGRKTNNNYVSWVEYPNVSTSGPARLACLFHGYPQGGDSGGPVYITSRAGGFIWGWILIDGSRRTCFSQARYIDDALGVTIKQ